MSRTTAPAEEPPPRVLLLRLAGVLVQVLSAVALLLGTIALVLVLQSGGAPLAITWALAAITGIVLGGLMPRGSLVAVTAGALLVTAFGVTLLLLDDANLDAILPALPASDLATISTVLVGLALAMLATAGLSLAAIPQALRVARARHAAEGAPPGAPAIASRSLPPTSPLAGPIPSLAPPSASPYAPPSASPLAPPPASPYAPPSASPYAPSAEPLAPPRPKIGASWNVGAPTMPPVAYPPGGPVPRASAAAPHSPAGLMAAPCAPPGTGASPHSPAGVTAMPYPPPGRGAAPHSSVDAAAAPYPPAASVAAPYPPPGPAAAPHPTPGPAAAPYPPPGPAAAPHLRLGPAAAPQAASVGPGHLDPAATAARATPTLKLRPRTEARSRRRVYLALGGVAIAAGVATGLIVSTSARPDEGAIPASTAPSSGVEPSAAVAERAEPVPAVEQGSAEPAAEPPASEPVMPTVPVHGFLAEQRAAIAQADAKALAATMHPDVIGFGIDASEVIEGRASFEAMALAQLAETPPDGFEVTSRFVAVGEEQNHAWTAEELELAGGDVPRRLAITQLLVFRDGAWQAVAVHWAVPVPDPLAERHAILGTLPRLAPVEDRAEAPGELAKAVRAAFASRPAFAAARSERPDGFNFGSAPGERVVGGVAVKRLFARLRSELRQTGGARVRSGAAWDPAQEGAPWIGVAALHVDYTQKTRAATDVTQTFRVLAVVLREGDTWKVVQSQFSNGGPVE